MQENTFPVIYTILMLKSPEIKFHLSQLIFKYHSLLHKSIRLEVNKYIIEIIFRL